MKFPVKKKKVTFYSNSKNTHTHTKHVRTVCAHGYTNTHLHTHTKKIPKCDNTVLKDYSNHRNRETVVSAPDGKFTQTR